MLYIIISCSEQQEQSWSVLEGLKKKKKRNSNNYDEIKQGNQQNSCMKVSAVSYMNEQKCCSVSQMVAATYHQWECVIILLNPVGHCGSFIVTYN